MSSLSYLWLTNDVINVSLFYMCAFDMINLSLTNHHFHNLLIELDLNTHIQLSLKRTLLHYLQSFCHETHHPMYGRYVVEPKDIYNMFCVYNVILTGSFALSCFTGTFTSVHCDLLICICNPSDVDNTNDNHTDLDTDVPGFHKFKVYMRLLGYNLSNSIHDKGNLIRFESVNQRYRRFTFDVDFRFSRRTWQAEYASKVHWYDIDISKIAIHFSRNGILNDVVSNNYVDYLNDERFRSFILSRSNNLSTGLDIIPSFTTLPTLVCSNEVMKQILSCRFSLNCLCHFPGRRNIEDVKTLKKCVRQILHRIIKYNNRGFLLSNPTSVFNTIGINKDDFQRNGIACLQIWPKQYTGWTYGLRFGVGEDDEVISITDVRRI